MRRIIIVFALSLFLFAVVAFSEELSIIQLHEGLNKISLSIINNWNEDVFRLIVEVDPKSLPEWLSILDTGKAIEVEKGSQSPDKLLLKLFVKDAPSEAEAEFPLTLKDSAGHQWSFNVKVNMGSNIPACYALYNNYPNPFNPSTTIRYALKESGHARLVIFNVLGQEVRNLVDKEQAVGLFTVKWDGRNDNGEKVSSGMYFYRLEAGNFVRTKRMMLVQ